MGRINTNVSALISQHRLGRSQRDLNTTLERLSSGLRINRGADDPAGLIASENLRSEIAGVTQAINNSQRASNVIATAEGSLSEVAALLVDIERLTIQAANTGAMSADEIAANQLQINSAVESITRIANTTTFAGRPLLDGSLDYVTTSVMAGKIASLQVNRASFGTQSTIPVQVDVTQSAQKAALYFLSADTNTSAITLEIKGDKGLATVILGSGAKTSAIMRAINGQSDVTGVTAAYINSAIPASGVVINSVDYGSAASISVKAISGGAFGLVDKVSGGIAATMDSGQDAKANINGHVSTGRGLELILNTSELEMTLLLSKTIGLSSTSFTITGGGALFQLGPSVETNQQVNIGIQSVGASRLGNATVGFLSDIVEGGAYALKKANGPAGASLIVKEAIRQVSVLRGRLGAFERNTLDTNVNALNITMENLTSAESSIRDADFAVETANMTRNQILVQAGTSVLSMANTTPQTVLSLLGGR
jgi:flagellin